MTQKVSIIIPLYKLTNRFKKDFERLLNLNYPDYEIIIVHDKGINFNHKRVKTINTGRDCTGPAEKRDMAIKEAGGGICAFIDDDAYPDKNWIKNAVKYLEDENLAAVGGPGLTPPEDSFMMRAGGLCYESVLGSGPIQYRFVKAKERKVEDFPAYNLFVKKSVLKGTGGFSSTFYGGEDTKLCLEIIKLKRDILYSPEVIVYHHRRPLFKEHLSQIGNVGLHRGYFVKKYPQTSRKRFYLLPSLFTIAYFAGLLISFFSQGFAALYGMAVILFLTIAFISCFCRSKAVLMSAVSSLGILMMHIAYGINFLFGLTKKELKT